MTRISGGIAHRAVTDLVGARDAMPLDAETPLPLITRARAGDNAATGQLLDKYRDYLIVLAGREIGLRLQRKVDPTDIVQDVFLEAHRQFPRFSGETEAQFFEWLRAILAGVLANTIRRYVGTQARNITLEQELADDLNHSSVQLAAWAIDPESSPSAQVARGEQTLIVANGLARLPEDYRQVLMLRHLDGLTFPEIAVKLNRSVDSVEKFWIRGLAKLKQVCSGTANHG